MATSNPNERAGVVRDETTGELILPTTQRPDGTWRKARRVKDGYIPLEEVPAYESKGMQFVKSIPDHPIGLGQQDIETMRKAKSDANHECMATKTMSKTAKKNARRKDKKKQKSDGTGHSETENVAKSLSLVTVSDKSLSDVKPTQEEIAKKVKNLRKKLCKVEELEDKINSGQLQNPEKEQLEKIKKKQTILDEIEDLELELND